MSVSPAFIKDRKIRMAIVGCGRISNSHFQAIEKHADDVELVSICDTNTQTLEQAPVAENVARFTRLDELLMKASDVDLVTLCTPSGLHPDQVCQIALSGKHAMTEKPMATRWRDGQRMVRVCDEQNRRLFVVKQNRLNATLQLLKKAVMKKRFGRIYMVNLNVFWTRPQSYYDQAAWRGTWEFDGGACMNQASHYIDLLHWLIGPVESVHAMTATMERNIEVEDSAVLNVRWRSGALGSVNVSMLTYPNNFEGSITILGEKGTVRVGGMAVNEIQHWEFADSEPEDEEIKKANYETASVYGFGHPLYYKNVINVFRGLEKPITDGREGLVSLELLIAIYLSARDRKQIALPLSY